MGGIQRRNEIKRCQGTNWKEPTLKSNEIRKIGFSILRSYNGRKYILCNIFWSFLITSGSGVWCLRVDGFFFQPILCKIFFIINASKGHSNAKLINLLTSLICQKCAENFCHAMNFLCDWLKLHIWFYFQSSVYYLILFIYLAATYKRARHLN